jgi:hypothetical protein
MVALRSATEDMRAECCEWKRKAEFLERKCQNFETRIRVLTCERDIARAMLP